MAAKELEVSVPCLDSLANLSVALGQAPHRPRSAAGESKSTSMIMITTREMGLWLSLRVSSVFTQVSALNS